VRIGRLSAVRHIPFDTGRFPLVSAPIPRRGARSPDRARARRGRAAWVQPVNGQGSSKSSASARRGIRGRGSRLAGRGDRCRDRHPARPRRGEGRRALLAERHLAEGARPTGGGVEKRGRPWIGRFSHVNEHELGPQQSLRVLERSTTARTLTPHTTRARRSPGCPCRARSRPRIGGRMGAPLHLAVDPASSPTSGLAWALRVGFIILRPASGREATSLVAGRAFLARRRRAPLVQPSLQRFGARARGPGF
jgi:hypothetical protein